LISDGIPNGNLDENLDGNLDENLDGNLDGPGGNLDHDLGKIYVNGMVCEMVRMVGMLGMLGKTDMWDKPNMMGIFHILRIRHIRHILHILYQNYHNRQSACPCPYIRGEDDFDVQIFRLDVILHAIRPDVV